MKIFLFGEIDRDNIGSICSVENISEYILNDYQIKYSSSGKAFLVKGSGKVNGFICEVDKTNIWLLDQWKGVLKIERREISDGLFSYFKYENIAEYNSIDSAIISSEFEKFEKRECLTSIERADIHLLIPGHFKGKKEQDWIIADNEADENNIGVYLQQKIQQSTVEEFDDPYFKRNNRYIIGYINVSSGKEEYYQECILMLIVHKTRLAVIDIYVPAATVSSHKILESFRENSLKINYSGNTYNLSELCSCLNFDIFGDKRSVVFSYDEISEEALLNLLVNEEKPMGKIIGEDFKKIANDNIAQYDTAKVYVSEVTMVEIVKDIKYNIKERLQSQAIELFFVEMLLLQDASVSKLNYTVRHNLEIERDDPKIKKSKKVLNDLVTEMSYAVNFTDYKQYYFPTVRLSAEKISKAFGLDTIRTRYNLNKQLLERMINDHSEAVEAEENKIKNSLLIIITLLSAIGTVYDILNLATDNRFISIAFYISCGVIFLGIALYLIIRTILRKNFLKKIKNTNNEYYEDNN